MANDFLGWLDQLERMEKSWGGIISQIEFTIGYKVFISGMSNEESFLPFTDDASRKEALETCKAFLVARQVTSRPQSSIQFRVFKDDVKGREVTWMGDRYFVTPIWTDAYKKIVRPAIEKLSLRAPQTFWGRITFAEDPSGRTRENRDGEIVPDLVAYPAEVFPNEQAATEAAGESSAPPVSGGPPVSTGLAVPTAWVAYPDQWKEQVTLIKAAVEGKAGPLIVNVGAYIKEAYGDQLGGTVNEVIAWFDKV